MKKENCSDAGDPSISAKHGGLWLDLTDIEVVRNQIQTNLRLSAYIRVFQLKKKKTAFLWEPDVDNECIVRDWVIGMLTTVIKLEKMIAF